MKCVRSEYRIISNIRVFGHIFTYTYRRSRSPARRWRGQLPHVHCSLYEYMKWYEIRILRKTRRRRTRTLVCSTVIYPNLRSIRFLHKTVLTERVMSHIWMSHVTHMNKSYRTYEWVMSHIQMSHVAHVNGSCHTYQCVMSRTWMSHTCEWVLSHVWMSHVTHINGSCRTELD